ncbi:hypothetical protein C6P45_004298 [Maudiozyma exigua]|uniref:Uncharacterized protein n=1 Tax=Maudiozyma exigua TaxID=34358 RepID=A0A9P6WAT2_MAUEX|nr:hypothetical protein C6P45_004298 [Kazachstania exigua]
MLRRDTATIRNNHARTKHSIFRSKRVIPQYNETICDGGLQDSEEQRFGDFSVLNHNNHPDPNGNPISSRGGLNNNNNNNHDAHS